jgi:hypothetical protein
VRSVETGVVSSQDYDEIVLATYSGKVVSFTNEPLDEADEEDVQGRTKKTVQRETQVDIVKKELAILRDQVSKEKKKLSNYAEEFIPVRYALHTCAAHMCAPSPLLALYLRMTLLPSCDPSQQFEVNTKCVLDPEQGELMAQCSS